MQNSFKADISDNQVAFVSAAASPWLTLLLIFSVFVLSSCANPPVPPPSPTPNPHPQKTSQLKISVQEGSNVDNVEVRSVWTIGNIGCAPIHPVSGAAIVKQVEVEEKVEKVGPYFLATIVDDRFLLDKCRWQGGAYEVHFMRDSHLLSVAGAGPSQFNKSGKLELTCTPPPALPVCDLRAREVFDRNHFHGVFNATLEKVK